jgi:Zn-dependent membrane protease YugP
MPLVYFDPLYFVFALPALILALWAQYRVQSAYSKFTRVANLRGLSGLDAARWLLGASGLSHLSVEGAPGHLSDHYDPRSKTLRLSAEVANGKSVAALGIVAHEVGHAQQDQTGYALLQVRAGIVPFVQVGSYLGPILFLIGMLLNFTTLAWLGILLFSGAVLFALVTLPVELDASRRALVMLRTNGLLDMRDLDGAQAVLNAAALTYVAALAQAVSNLLYYVLLASRLRRRG